MSDVPMRDIQAERGKTCDYRSAEGMFKCVTRLRYGQ